MTLHSAGLKLARISQRRDKTTAEVLFRYLRGERYSKVSDISNGCRWLEVI